MKLAFILCLTLYRVKSVAWTSGGLFMTTYIWVVMSASLQHTADCIFNGFSVDNDCVMRRKSDAHMQSKWQEKNNTFNQCVQACAEFSWSLISSSARWSLWVRDWCKFSTLCESTMLYSNMCITVFQLFMKFNVHEWNIILDSFVAENILSVNILETLPQLFSQTYLSSLKTLNYVSWSSELNYFERFFPKFIQK